MFLSTKLPENTNVWITLRAVEWENYPSFFLIPLCPVLLLFAPWWTPILLCVVLELPWMTVRHRFVSMTMARLGFRLHKLTYLTALACAAYLFYNKQWINGGLALAWPWIGAFIGLPGNIDKIKAMFRVKIGPLLDEESTAAGGPTS